VRFEQTLQYEHVVLPPTTAVVSMLDRAAARAGRALSYRVVVSDFDAALRVVEADWGISVIPRPIATRDEREKRLHVIAMSDGWAKRRFAVYFREQAALPPAAARLVDFLVQKSGV
jgi:DNA-binding transcriptional LysR family regulator